MVDPIGAKTVTATDVAAPRVAAATPTSVPTVVPVTTGMSDTARSDTARSDTAQSEATALAKTMASAAPVDTNRVAEIRKAIANGTFPILPATIADRLMALRLEWNSDDKA